jgi:hypothetical protein
LLARPWARFDRSFAFEAKGLALDTWRAFSFAELIEAPRGTRNRSSPAPRSRAVGLTS